jgi:hypothetical protein
MEELLEEEEFLFIENFLRADKTEKDIALAWNFSILVQKIFDYGVVV